MGLTPHRSRLPNTGFRPGLRHPPPAGGCESRFLPRARVGTARQARTARGADLGGVRRSPRTVRLRSTRPFLTSSGPMRPGIILGSAFGRTSFFEQNATLPVKMSAVTTDRRAYVQRRRAAGAAETRARIVASARELIPAAGSRLGVDEIARHAGVAVQTIYDQFGSKG